MGNAIRLFSATSPGGGQRCTDCTGYQITVDDTMYRKVPIPDGDAPLAARLLQDIRGDDPLEHWPETSSDTSQLVFRYDFADVSRLYVIGDRMFVFERPTSQYTLPDSIPRDFVSLIASVLASRQQTDPSDGFFESVRRGDATIYRPRHPRMPRLDRRTPSV